MGIFDGCLLACDVDGTLTENGYINPKNKEKIEFFEKEGGRFVIATGRGVAALGPVIEKIPDISISVVANGCIIYDYKKQEILYDKEIIKKEFLYAQKICELCPTVGVEIHSGASAYTLKRNIATTLHQEYEKFVGEDVDYEFVSNLKWNKVIYIFESAEDREMVKAELEKDKTECSFINTCAVINGEMQYYLEQVPGDVSKAKGLNELCKILDINSEKLFAIGDYYNDLEMLSLANISAVPFSSPDDVKQYADYLTCSCDDGAVADFINYLTSKFSAVD